MGIFANFRRSHILKTRLLDEESWSDILAQHPIFDRLTPVQRGRLRELATIILHEKHFQAVGGIELDDFRRQVIAAQAALPILELGPDWYRQWKGILVIPEAHSRTSVRVDKASVVQEGDETLDGEAPEFGYGTVVLAWPSVEDAGWGDGDNVVIHEAAHILDALDGEYDGRPPLHDRMDPGEWRDVFTAAFRDMQRKASRKGRQRSSMDMSAADDDAEFFAVTSEYFFETPRILRSEYPDVCRLLADFYRQDPLGRPAGPPAAPRP